MNSFERKVRPDDTIRNLPKADQALLIDWLTTMSFADVLLLAEQPRPEGLGVKLSYSALQRFHTNYYREPRGEVFDNCCKLAALYQSKPNPYAALVRDHLERHWFQLSLLPHEGENRLVRFTNLMLRLRAQELREKKFAATHTQNPVPDAATVPMITAQASDRAAVPSFIENQTPSAATFSTSFPSPLPPAQPAAGNPTAHSTGSVWYSSEPVNQRGNPNLSAAPSQGRPANPSAENSPHAQPLSGATTGSSAPGDEPTTPPFVETMPCSNPPAPTEISQLPAFTRLHPHIFPAPILQLEAFQSPPPPFTSPHAWTDEKPSPEPVLT